MRRHRGSAFRISGHNQRLGIRGRPVPPPRIPRGNPQPSLCQIATLQLFQVTLWAVTVYTFMWISVDRYLAVRKPLRYETLQTKTRCQCWMAFTWISSAMLCCPPLLGFNQPLFDRDAYVCMLDWGSMAAYSATLSILILGPSLITIVYTYSYIFMMLKRLRSGYPFHDKEYATALSENLSNPSHMMSFALVVAFWCSWTPYISVKLYEYFTGVKFQMQFLHFGVVWLGFLNSFWKALILIILSPQFRFALRIFCMTICCKYKGRLQAELIGMESDDWLKRSYLKNLNFLNGEMSLTGLAMHDFGFVVGKMRKYWCQSTTTRTENDGKLKRPISILWLFAYARRLKCAFSNRDLFEFSGSSWNSG